MNADRRPDDAQTSRPDVDRDLAAFGRAARQATPPASPWLRTRIMAHIEAEAEKAERAPGRSFFSGRTGFALGGLAAAGLCLALTIGLYRGALQDSGVLSPGGPSVTDAWESLFGESETPLTGVAALLDFSDAESETTLLADLGDMFTDLPLLGPLDDADQDAGLDFLDLEDATDGGLLS